MSKGGIGHLGQIFAISIWTCLSDVEVDVQVVCRNVGAESGYAALLTLEMCSRKGINNVEHKKRKCVFAEFQHNIYM